MSLTEFSILGKNNLLNMSMEMLLLDLLFDDDSDLENLLLSSTSSSSDSEDDEELLMRILAMSDQRKLSKSSTVENDYVERVVPGYSEFEFKSHFRMLPSTFEFILSLVNVTISSTNTACGRKPISSRIQLLLTLSVMATPDSYRSIHKRFNVGKATAIRSVRRVSQALHGLAARFILWPVGDKANEVMHEFELNSGFPNVIGAVGNTQIRIGPKQDAQSHSEQKTNRFVQVQAVCTHNLLFTNVFAGYAESAVDARAFKYSWLQRFKKNSEAYFPNNSHLVGDASFDIHSNIMVPYEDNEYLTERQKNFNYCLTMAKTSIDRTFTLWRCRWRSIYDCLSMTTMDKIPQYIVATCVLHNICVLKGDTILPYDPSSRAARNENLTYNHTSGCETKRTVIMNNLPLKIV